MSRRPEESSTFGALCAGTEVSRFQSEPSSSTSFTKFGLAFNQLLVGGPPFDSVGKSSVLRGLVSGSSSSSVVVRSGVWLGSHSLAFWGLHPFASAEGSHYRDYDLRDNRFDFQSG
ncbi:hypothetical protein BASA61_002563 [Batrachochytrium salamandrivorans]|nr:hypothetical protein BASA61_002563 [Batrachochytrium salamandrivorans]